MLSTDTKGIGRWPLSLTIVSVLFLAPGILLADESLQLGQKPPPLQVRHWVNGPAVAWGAATANRVVLVDLWGPWCPPCVDALGERAQLSRTHGDRLTIVAICNDPPDNVLGVIEDYPAPLSFSIGCDDAGKTFGHYLKGAGIRRLPFSVIVDGGKVVWYGDPRERIESVVSDVIAGTFDLEGFRKRMETRSRLDELGQQLSAALSNRQCDALLETTRTLATLDPGPEDRARLAQLINQGAWVLLTEEPCAGRFTKPAVSLAKKAVDLTDGQNAAILDTYARALFDSGQVVRAIEIQQTAVDLSGIPDLAQALERYLAAAPPDYTPPPRKPAPAKKPEAAPATPAVHAQSEISRESAVADLDALHELLRLNYAGYDDLQWQLRRKGESWEKRHARFSERLRAKESWKVRDLYQQFVDFLEPVEDVHFWIRGPLRPGASGEDRRNDYDPPLEQLYTSHTAYFTGLRVVAEDQRYTVFDSPSDEEVIGCELRGVPPVDARQLSLDKPYLLRTVPLKAGHEEFYVGVFRDREPEGPLVLKFRRPDGAELESPFDLHRGGVFRKERGSAWELLSPPEVRFPTLGVRTCRSQDLEDLTKTADSLRTEDVVVLDLRRNGGGSDSPVAEWNLAFSRQTFHFHHAANLSRGVPSGRNRWTCHVAPTVAENWSSARQAPGPYTGQLFILMDRGVASSGETFVGMSCQIPKAIILGENSAGCTDYGNADVRKTFAHSGITVRFGRTKFVANRVRPIREGVGFLPDYWLDHDDPYEAMGRLLRR